MHLARRAVLGAGLAVGVVAAPARAQDLSQRFSIAEVQDTTFTFAVGRTRWVKAKQRGIAVDAQRQDALVARFRVLRVDAGVATALITGATTRVSPTHTVVMQRPPDRWYRSWYFWSGAVIGLAGGVVAGSTAR